MTIPPNIDPTELKRIAAAYPPEAKHTPRWEREMYLTDLQQLAWTLRFDPQAATLISSEGSLIRNEGIAVTATASSNLDA